MYRKVREFLFSSRCDASPSMEGRRIPLRLDHSAELVDPRSGHPYISNSIRTTRYTLWDFLPKQIFFQLTRLANFYFLTMAILQLVPGLSTTGNFTVLIPLLVFICVSISKEGYDDIKRYKLDQIENRRSTTVLRSIGQPSTPASHRKRSSGTEMELLRQGRIEPGVEWIETQWQDLKVGDVIRLSRDDDIPADIVLLHADGEAAYIETMALDGETNLKRKQAPKFLERCSTPEGIARCHATFVVENPNQNLYRFEGQVAVNGREMPLSDLEVIYRGCTLRNTTSAIGLIINTGEETKIRMNANQHPQAKRPALEKFLNKVVVMMALFVIVVSALGYLGYALWRGKNEEDAWYMYSTEVPFQEIFFGFLIMFNSLVPMSLIMGLEVIKVNQMNSISNDLQMYHAPSGTPIGCNTSTITDDLGQIGYVFSDKTGTLTENDMKLRKLNIAGTSWAHRIPTGEDRLSSESDYSRDTSMGSGWDGQPQQSPDSAPELTTDELLEYMRRRPESLFEIMATNFLLCLALCHTAQPERRGDKLEFQASSPDELALVKAAQELGFLAVERSAHSITVQMLEAGRPVRRTYEILDVLEFNSDRKRMSIILRCPDGRLWLVCKGADTILLPRLTAAQHTTGNSDQSCEHLGQTGPHGATSQLDLPAKFQHLGDASIHDEVEAYKNCLRSIDRYAREGLRTLLFCQRFPSECEYQEWKRRYNSAQTSLVNRQEHVDAISEEIEKAFELVGASAIEDKLQDGVPETIEKLRRANIKIWMLTGDKRETAVNIAHSARICGPTSAIYILDVEKGPLEAQCVQIMDALQQESKPSAHTALIIDGGTLTAIQTQDNAESRIPQLFYSIIPIVDSVICCRASPSQKALLVTAIKERKTEGGFFSRLTSPRLPLTLAIGDGTNDCAMITAAHVGIGISGKEGQQAARIADFSITQFRYLYRLLVVHGRWSYHRTTRFILATFWKELFQSVPQGLYQCFAGFTGTSLFDSMALILYGSLFSAGAIIAIGTWEQDLKAETLMAVPELYTYGQMGRGLNAKNFLGWVLNGLSAGVFVVLVCWAGYGSSEDMRDNGLYAFGLVNFLMCVIWANVKILLLEMHNKTILPLGIFAATIIAAWAWAGITAVTSQPSLTPYAVKGAFTSTFGQDPIWWMTLIVGIVLLGAMELVFRCLRQHRLIRTFGLGFVPSHEKAGLTGGGVRTGFEPWYLHIWQEIERDPDAKARLEHLMPKLQNLQDAPPHVDDKGKEKRPRETAHNQQRRKAWRPVLTPKIIVKSLFAIVIVMIPIGSILIWASHRVQHLTIDYTNCATQSPTASNHSYPPPASVFAQIPTALVARSFRSSNPATAPPTWAHSYKQVSYGSFTTLHNTTVCSLQFDVENSLPPPVLLQYRLSNFYQNHRDYLSSLSVAQLEGKAPSGGSVGACAPLDVDPETGRPFYPCGLVANSVFNDTYSAPRRLGDGPYKEGEGTTYNMTTRGIASGADREALKRSTYVPDDIVPPPNWRLRYPDGYADGVPDFSMNEELMVWMRTAAMPSFRKLAMRNDGDTMPTARYQIDIEDHYKVASFGGTKSIILTSSPTIGGHYLYLGALCFLVGGTCWIVGVVSAASNCIKSRKLSDHTLLA